ncbi:MAG: Sll0314/Alr1548 family TPR repeat-containing protein [Pseudanabaena sp. ELA607]|jgi:tetratricopeptide (TPR) repeat protein
MKNPMAMVSALAIAGVLTIAAALPSYAADPFRTAAQKPRASIGDATSKAFELMFRQGNFPGAVQQIDVALASRKDNQDPLIYAMRASVGFVRDDLEEMRKYGAEVRKYAHALRRSDRLRFHLYTGVSDLIEAGYIFRTQGITSVGRVLPIVNRALDHIRTAQDIDEKDPELNLIKGFMDILIASALPGSELDSALVSLQKYASPDYLKWRGIAMAYRDAKRNAEALEAINQAINSASGKTNPPANEVGNPDLSYLKAQILRMNGKQNESLDYFLASLAQAKQLPPQTLEAVQIECRNLLKELGKTGECPAAL